MLIHQIYGLFDDGKEMPDLFKKKQQEVLKWSAKNKYDYILWDKRACEELIIEFPEYLYMYSECRHPVMKVDIIRFLILYKHGGCYIDLDCEPAPLLGKLKKDDFICAYKVGNKREHYEMEIVQSIKGNIFLLKFLDYVETQIMEKDNIKIYEKWKARYIYQTTGPYSLNRFINKGLNEIDMNIKKYIINEPSTKPYELNLKGNEDFISHPSCSYLI